MQTDKILMTIVITETLTEHGAYYRAHIQDSRTCIQKISLQPAMKNILACATSVIDYLFNG